MPKVLKEFRDKDSGAIVAKGSIFEASAARLKELAKGGFVEEAKDEPKAKVKPKEGE